MRKEYTAGLVLLVLVVGFFSFAKSHLLISNGAVQIYQPTVLNQKTGSYYALDHNLRTAWVGDSQAVIKYEFSKPSTVSKVTFYLGTLTNEFYDYEFIITNSNGLLVSSQKSLKNDVKVDLVITNPVSSQDLKIVVKAVSYKIYNVEVN